MHKIRLGLVEARFAEIVWKNAPVTTKQLVELCSEQLNWARTTTYTVLKKLCNRGILHTENGLVTVLLTKAEFQAVRSEQFIDDSFGGSLPAFLAAFSSRRKLTPAELAEIRQMLDSYDTTVS